MSGDLLISNGRVIDPANGVDERTNLIIRDGKVDGLFNHVDGDWNLPVLDASRLIVTPGFIDSHVHLREPGAEYKETIATGTAAAAAGGICSVVAMPNTDPSPDSPTNLEKIKKLARTACVRFYPIACITRERAGCELAPLADLVRCGAVAFSDDGDPVGDESLMRQALMIARDTGVPVFPHEEVKKLTAGGCMHDGEVSARLGVKGMPAAGEEEMIARDIELVRQTGGPLHIAHVSTAGSVALIRKAKGERLPVTCEVLPHHFILTDEEVARLGAAAKMSPPLRSAGDVDAMLAALGDGTIDVISTDHAPHSAAEKECSLEEAAFGIVGLETAIGLTLTYLVERTFLSLPQAIEKWTWAPARILKLPGGRLDPGFPGDVTIIDPEKEWSVDPNSFRSLSKNSPFAGYVLKGKAVATVINGEIVYAEEGY